MVAFTHAAVRTWRGGSPPALGNKFITKEPEAGERSADFTETLRAYGRQQASLERRYVQGAVSNDESHQPTQL